MAEVKIQCGHCQAKLRIKLPEDKTLSKIRCPQCGGDVALSHAGTPPNTVAGGPPGKQPTSKKATPSSPTGFDDLGSITSTKSNQLPAYLTGPQPSARAKSPPLQNQWAGQRAGQGNRSRLLLVAVLAFVGLGVAGGLTYWFVLRPQGGVTDGPLSANGSTAQLAGDSSNLLPEGAADGGEKTPPLTGIPARPEAVEQVSRAHDQLRRELEQKMAQIAVAERPTQGAATFDSYLPQFQQLFYRAAQARPVAKTLTQILEEDDRLRAEISRLQQQSNPNQPVDTIWQIGSSVDPDDTYRAAMFKLTEKSMSVGSALRSRLELPDPQTETSKAYDWSAEDRRVLAAYWLQGAVQRDVTTELVRCLREGDFSEKAIQRCFAAIDKQMPLAVKLAAVPSAQGTLMISEPKNSPYAKQALSARAALLTIKESHPTQVVQDITDITIQLSDAIENLQFSRSQSVLEAGKQPTWEIYRGMLAKRAAEAEEKLAAEKRAEQERLAAEQRRKQQAEQAAAEQAKAEERRRQEEAARLASKPEPNRDNNPNNNGGGGGPFGRGPIGDRGQPPFNRGGQLPGDRPSMPPDFGNRPSTGPTVPPGTIPQPPPRSPQAVVITTAQLDGESHAAIVEVVKTLSTGYQINSSNGQTQIVIDPYTAELETLESKFTMLKFTKIDTAARQIQAEKK